jgi:hypothetical protein
MLFVIWSKTEYWSIEILCLLNLQRESSSRFMNIQRLIKVTKMHFVDEIYSRVDNMLFRGDEMHFVVTKI